MVPKHEDLVERLATEAIRLGADLLEVEYKDGYEEVFAAALREELHRIARRKRRIAVRRNSV